MTTKNSPQQTMPDSQLIERYSSKRDRINGAMFVFGIR